MTVQPSAYVDVQGLKSGISGGQERLATAVTQFEAMFLDLWLKSAREATSLIGEGSYFDSEATQMHQQMLEQQLSLNVAQSGGIGLADMLLSQLIPQTEAATTPSPVFATPDRSSTLAGRNPAQLNPAQADGPSGPGVQTATPEASEPSEQKIGFKASAFTDDESFVGQLLPVVRELVGDVGLNPLAVLAQAALETGWGQRLIHRADGTPGHNLFGIKANDWDGDSVSVTTMEHELFGFVAKTAEFRAYGDWREGIRDYLNLLTGSERYSEVLATGTDGSAFATALQEAGYATDPDYAEKIINVLERLGAKLGLEF